MSAAAINLSFDRRDLALANGAAYRAESLDGANRVDQFRPASHAPDAR